MTVRQSNQQPSEAGRTKVGSRRKEW